MPRKLLLILTLIGLTSVLVWTAFAQDSTYTVRYGDVLDIIAASVDLSASCIAEQSGLENPNKLRPGDTLILSAACPPYDGLIPIEREASTQSDDEDDTSDQGGGSARASSQQAESVGDTYVVESGDVLDLIGAAFDLSAGCLAESNDLGRHARIYVGDEIFLDPDCPPYDGVAPVLRPRDDVQALGQGGGGTVYTVRYGDTLDKIGAAYNLAASCLGESNSLENPSRIFPGDEIRIDPGCPPYDGLALVLQSEE